MVSRLSLYAFTALLLSGGFAGPISAGQPCCEITAIDKKTGVVTARDVASRQLIQFKVDNAVLLNRIRLNQKVSVDLNAGRASIEGVQGQFRIVAATPGPANRFEPGARARPPSGLSPAGTKSAPDGAAGTAKSRAPIGATPLVPGKKGAAADPPVGAPSAGDTSNRDLPVQGGANEAPGGNLPAPEMLSEPPAASPQEGYSGAPADTEYPSDSSQGYPTDYGQSFPSGATDGGVPSGDGGSGYYSGQQPGAQGGLPAQDGGKGFSYGTGEAPIQGDVPWWKQPPQQ